ncbi:F-box/LRR-repeat protein 18-like isoform X2 [Mizuhopecten yessoensis]|uniref:F-box/LRR-repeat protein 18-like isoform X2 n=1 Tax=Mizuhopecten yessoensis TaxID=6573 RepID=UPI000B459739|nr:F-box/LRR-repeat protein 18-like isoform X2 [Mizuhopecten yessoensis]
MADMVSAFEVLPDNIVLNILSFLSCEDLCDIRNVNHMLRRLSSDRSLVWNSDFEGCYKTSEEAFEMYIQAGGPLIHCLNLSHCYWLSGRSVSNALKLCMNLKELYILDISLTAKKLIKILCGLPNLVTFAFTVTNMDEFDTELEGNNAARLTMMGIKHLTIHFKVPLSLRTEASISVQFLQKKTTFFEHCRDLESFHVLGHPNLGCGLPKLLLQPNVDKVENLKNVKEISLNYAIDPAARIFYYGTLLSVAKLQLQMTTVLNPSANFGSQIRSDFWNIFWKSQYQLQNLDISSISIQKIFTHVFDPDVPKPNLQYLNLSDTYFTTTEGPTSNLTSLICVCPNLKSLNLRNSQIIFTNPSREKVDVAGISSLVSTCRCLSEVNLGGIHMHDPEVLSRVSQLLASCPGLKSLAVSCCCCSYQSAKCKVSSASAGGGPPLKRQRTGALPSTSSHCDESKLCPDVETGGLESLVRGCPGMVRFELVNAGLTRPVIHRGQNGLMPKSCVYKPCSESTALNDQRLFCIGKWKHLKYLQLAGLPGIMTGSCLVAIATGCHFLEQLHIAYLGLMGHPNFARQLCQALPEFKALKDLRVEHGYQSVDSHFCKAAQSCKTLQRVCVMSWGGTIDSASVISLIANCPSLVALQLFTDANRTQCRRLQKAVEDRFGSVRPALRVSIWPLFDTDTPSLMNNIPTKHLEELTIFSSRVSDRPPNWKW